MKILDVENLSIAFKSGKKIVPTVTDISFSLEKGSILALVGESGCGKSISCMALAKLLGENAVISGSAKLTMENGKTCDTLALSKHDLGKIRGKGIAYIFQEPSMSLNPVFTVGNQIIEAILLHRPEIKNPEQEAVECLKAVGIPAPETRIKAYPHEMSGGMLQRVMIAMALACNPAVLVADEPTTALDVTIQAQILELLAKLKRERGMSIILVTHNLGIVAELADRVCVMYAGRIVEEASARELVDSPHHPYTQALLAAVPVLGGEKKRLATIQGIVPAPANYPQGCRFADRCPKAIQACRDEMPELVETEQGRLCACHLVKGFRK